MVDNEINDFMKGAIGSPNQNPSPFSLYLNRLGSSDVPRFGEGGIFDALSPGIDPSKYVENPDDPAQIADFIASFRKEERTSSRNPEGLTATQRMHELFPSIDPNIKPEERTGVWPHPKGSFTEGFDVTNWQNSQLGIDFLKALSHEGGRYPYEAGAGDPEAAQAVGLFKGLLGPTGGTIGAGITRHALDNLLTGAKVDPALLGMNVPPKRYFSSILTLGERGPVPRRNPSKDIRIGIFDNQKGGAMVAVAEGELLKKGTYGTKKAKGDVLKIGWVRPLYKHETDILNKIGIKATQEVEKVSQPGHYGRLPIGGKEFLQMTRKTQKQIPSMGGIAGFRVSGARRAHAREADDLEMLDQGERGSAAFGGKKGFQAVKRTGETPKEAFTRVWQETANLTGKKPAARQAAKKATGTYEKLPNIDHLTDRVLANLEKLDMYDLRALSKMSQSFRERIIALVNKNPETLQRIGRMSKQEEDVLVREGWPHAEPIETYRTTEISVPQTAEEFANQMGPW